MHAPLHILGPTIAQGGGDGLNPMSDALAGHSCHWLSPRRRRRHNFVYLLRPTPLEPGAGERPVPWRKTVSMERAPHILGELRLPPRSPPWRVFFGHPTSRVCLCVLPVAHLYLILGIPLYSCIDLYL